eukprot:3547984-Prymnesium_polylepis.1
MLTGFVGAGQRPRPALQRRLRLDEHRLGNSMETVGLQARALSRDRPSPSYFRLAQLTAATLAA